MEESQIALVARRRAVHFHAERMALQMTRANQQNHIKNAKIAGSRAKLSAGGMKTRTAAKTEQSVMNMPGSRHFQGPLIGNAPRRNHWTAINSSRPASTFLWATTDEDVGTHPRHETFLQVSNVRDKEIAIRLRPRLGSWHRPGHALA